MPEISIRFNDKQYKEIKAMADFEGQTISSYMKKAILEKIEDDQDYKDAVRAKNESNRKIYSEKEVIKELNMFYHTIASSDTFPITPKHNKREKVLQDLDNAFSNANIPTKQFKNEKEATGYLRDDKNW